MTRKNTFTHLGSTCVILMAVLGPFAVALVASLRF